ncbi:hypothetical protein F5B17DRAFT_58028 [Nemania serpens]|nr:hypothetical protein F5B17DRAFT_58028 [Nemania serpens]
MPEYDYIKISTSGLPRFVRSQSFSHHHHHHNHHPRHHARATRCPDDCACVTLDDWTALVERERTAHAANEKLARENRSLKSDLRAAYDETRRLQDEVAQLKGRSSREEDIAAKFRRRLAELKAELDDKEHALHDIRKAKDLADIRVRELTQTVTNQGVEVSQLADDVERLGRALKKDQHDLGVRTEEAREAWSLVSELRRQLRRCRDPLAFRRRYDFA